MSKADMGCVAKLASFNGKSKETRNPVFVLEMAFRLTVFNKTRNPRPRIAWHKHARSHSGSSLVLDK